MRPNSLLMLSDDKVNTANMLRMQIMDRLQACQVVFAFCSQWSLFQDVVQSEGHAQ